MSSGANTRILSVAGHLEEGRDQLPHRPLSAKQTTKQSNNNGNGGGLGLGMVVGVAAVNGVTGLTPAGLSTKGISQKRPLSGNKDIPLPPPPPPLTGSAALLVLLQKKPGPAMAHLMTQKETKKWVQLEDEMNRLKVLEEEHIVQVNTTHLTSLNQIYLILYNLM